MGAMGFVQPELSPTRRGFLQSGVAGFASSVVFGKPPELVGVDPIAELIKLEVKLAHWVRGKQTDILEAPLNVGRANWLWVDYGVRWPAFTLTHLFTTEHPDNPLFGAEWCAGLAMKLIDKEVAYWHYDRDHGRPIDTGETPHYVAAYVLERLRDRVAGQRRRDWLEHETAWAAQALVRPLGITGGYHDSWRMTGLYRLGKVLDKPEWTEMGTFLFRQLLELQTKEGFWEDGRHHGPSARYCGLMLPSLAWMYRWTGDEAFGNAARRLADFMATYAYPDSVTVGAFDGRDCNVRAYFPNCPGLELTPKGRAYAARAFALWRELGMFDDVNKSAQSTRDLPRLAFYSADTCEYLSLYAPKPSDAIDVKSALPLDRDGVLENHTAEFDGLMIRKGPWVLALSSQNSAMHGIFRLERQSRIEIWHQRARLIAGGGHNREDWPIPHANVIMDNGYGGPSAFGAAPPGSPRRISQHYYRPSEVKSRVVQGIPELELVFGHGTVRFRFSLPDAQSGLIEADWQVRRVERLCIQLPLVLLQGAELWLNGERQAYGSYALRKSEGRVEIRGGPYGGSLALSTPPGAVCRVHYPLLTGVFHNGAEKHRQNDPIRNWFDLALVSCQWTKPERTGRAKFALKVA
jgi:hypothetical protein